MKVNDHVRCVNFPCADVRHEGYCMPGIEINPNSIRLILISEASPENSDDYYYAPGDPAYIQTTLLALNDAGVDVHSLNDLLDKGVYLTTAVKCAKTGYGIQTATVQECSRLLEMELVLFPNVQVYLLMGDVAIKAANAIAKRRGEGRAIPAGSTYKIRLGEFYFLGKRVFPSYVQVGPSFGIEKSKRRMIAEDIRTAIHLLS